jgi:branched-chain amino acid transport system permease protein
MSLNLIVHLLVLASIYGILALSLNIMVGNTGLFNLGLAAFYGIGAYTSAVLSRNFGVPVWAAILAGIGLSGAVGFLIGIPTLRLVGDYLAVVTMGLGEIARAVFKNWIPVTRGPMGLPGIPPVRLFGVVFESATSFLVLALLFLVVSFVVAERIRLSPFGRVLRGIREDEMGAQALGKDTYWFKMASLVAGSALAGAAGALFAHYIRFIDPSTFVMWLTFFIFLAIMMGGLGNNLGAVVATAVLLFMREGLRFTGLPASVSAPLQQVIFGLLLIIMTIFVPKGLIPERKPRYVSLDYGEAEKGSPPSPAGGGTDAAVPDR